MPKKWSVKKVESQYENPLTHGLAVQNGVFRGI
jgi:hypothetical protein